MQRVGKSSVVDTDQQCATFASAVREGWLGAVGLLDLEGRDVDLPDLLWGLIAIGLLLGLRAGCHRGLCDVDGGGMVNSLVVGGDGGQGLEVGIRLAQVERELEVRALTKQSQVIRSRNKKKSESSFLLTRLKNFEKELGLPPEEDEVVVVVLVTLRPLSSMVDWTTTVGSVLTTPPCWLLMALLYWLNWSYCCCSSALYWTLCPLPVLPLLLCPPSPL